MDYDIYRQKRPTWLIWLLYWSPYTLLEVKNHPPVLSDLVVQGTCPCRLSLHPHLTKIKNRLFIQMMMWGIPLSEVADNTSMTYQPQAFFHAVITICTPSTRAQISISFYLLVYYRKVLEETSFYFLVFFCMSL